MRCHSCGTEVRPEQKYCSECGTALGGGAPVPPERSQVDRPRPLSAQARDEVTAAMRSTAPPGTGGATTPPPPPPDAEASPWARRPDDAERADDADRADRADDAEGADRADDADVTIRMPATPDDEVHTPLSPRPVPPPPDRQRQERTAEMVAVPPAPPMAPTFPASQRDVPGEMLWSPDDRRDRHDRRRGDEGERGHEFRLRPLFLVALLGAAATVVGVLMPVVGVVALGPDAPFAVGEWKVNDFGTNNAVAALVAAGVMLLGGLGWCLGFRWAAGLAGGAGAALAGWAALLIGLAEVPLANAEAGAAVTAAQLTRDIGYWTVAGAGAVGLVVLFMSMARMRSDGRAGLDPWIAALGAVSFVVAVGGPLIPLGTADFSGNFSSDSLGVDLPTAFFVGRLVQLGLLGLLGVIGFLLVRRWGLGLAIGSGVAVGWLAVTAATETTSNPIGPAFANPQGPGFSDLQPHGVTVVGLALAGFFALVAVVMALLDRDR